VDIRRRTTEMLSSLADRLGISPWSAIAGSTAVVAAALAGWWAFATPAPPPVEQVLPRVSETAITVTGDPTAPSAATTIVVHVDGAVALPGVHELPLDARVVDAIDAAAGLLVDADRERLNLAAPVSDGQRVWVPWVGEDEPVVVPLEGGTTTGAATSGGVVDLNTADQAALETLPGIGPSIAGAILRHRETEGSFDRVEDLLEVAGIGPSRLAQLAPLVEV